MFDQHTHAPGHPTEFYLLAKLNKAETALNTDLAYFVLQQFCLLQHLRHFLDFTTEHMAAKSIQPEQPVYHGAMHMGMVMLNAYEGAVSDLHPHSQAGVRLIYDQPGTLLFEQTRELLAAAMFHDFLHSLGRQPDVINIANAVHGLTRVNQLVDHTLQFSPEAMRRIVAMIAATCYPHSFEPLDVPSRILRDADMMTQYLHVGDDIQFMFHGLFHEFNTVRQRTHGQSVTWTEFLMGQKAFSIQQQSNWLTDWAKKKAQFVGWERACGRVMDALSEIGPPEGY